ncbi:MAG: BamA/TamA family outer membrane protein [Bacteroidales bacterium]|jgi:outer membrane protein assembly factor BamA|nr:BamA/TamA family outer membrane protein [Bacteroidales bacterium]
MIRLRKIHIALVFTAALVAAGCSNTKFLTGNQLLYTGRENVFIGEEGKFKDPHVIQIAASVTSYKPNNSIGGKRLLPPVGLWYYNYRTPEDSARRPGWFYRTLAKEPVFVSKVSPEARCHKLESDLFGNGYFQASVWSAIDTNDRNPKKAGIIYYIKPGHPFRYNNISFAPPGDAVDSIISGYQPEMQMKTGDIFNLETVRAEAKKMTDLVVEDGYYYFNQEKVKYIADTTAVPYKIDLRIEKDNENIQKGGRKYSIDEITVWIKREVDSLSSPGELTTMSDGIKIISTARRLHPEVISRAIYFRTGDSYSATSHRQTVTHLGSYGIFKFINVQFIPDPDSTVSKLDLMIELTPMKDINLDLETNVVTKSTGFSGPGFAATLTHGNLSRAANKLQLRLTGGLEWQVGTSSGSTLGTTSYNLGLSASIVFPKLVGPALIIKPGRFNLPKTSVTMAVEFLNKVQYYRMSSIGLGYGYQWRKSSRVTQSFYPVYVNSIDLLKTTPEFDTLMLENPYIRKSFEEQFIAGMKYDFTYDNNLVKRPHGFYFQAGVGTSGNAIDLIKRISSPDTERPYSIIGNVYSQFIKLSTDVRYYRNLRDHSFVFRLYTGVGYSYSNSVVMPYVEQFYSGGSNSIRAFLARSLGPGSYLPPEDPDSDEDDIIDQTGDIKLEGNIEYRIRLSKVLHGALFLEAGNVWLLNEDETRPGADFNFNTFTNELAVGTGFGFRFDFDFFILRTDFGFPLRTPYLNGDSYWVRSTTDFFDGLIFSLAIGYPF